MINITDINNKLKIQKRLSNAYELINHLSNTNKFIAFVFDKLLNNKALLILYDKYNNFKKMIKVELPTGINIQKYDQLNIELYYNAYKFNSTWFPFTIKIIELLKN
jgi:hypothetical protein